jgi:glycosyltransferase involved in cell wall biosynthesis
VGLVRICKIYGGTFPWEVRVEKIAHALRDAGHQMTLVCRGEPGAAVAENRHGIDIRRLSPEGLRPRALGTLSTLPFPLNPRWTRELARIVRERSIDLLLVRDIPLALNALTVARRARIPLVLDMAENYPAMLRDLLRWSDSKVASLVSKNPWVAAATERWVVRRCDRILVVVEESRERLLRLGVAPERVSIVSNTPTAPSAVDASCVRPARDDGRALRLVYVGGLQAGRGLETMLLAVSQFRRRSKVHLSILGEGSTRAALERQANELGLGSDVTFSGWVDPRAVPQHICDSDVGVVPHLVSDHTNTTIPNKLFDYMAYARPVLVSDAAPMRRIVREEGCGLDHRSGDAPDVVSKLEAFREAESRARFGAQGRRAVVERYNWDRDAARLVAAIGSAQAR